MSAEAFRTLSDTDIRRISDLRLLTEVRRRINNGNLQEHLGDSAKEGIFGAEQWDLTTKEVAQDNGVQNALSYWKRGQTREALHHLANALGRDWDGLGELQPKDLQ